MKRIKRILSLLLLIFGFCFVSCDEPNAPTKDDTIDAEVKYKVTLVFNNGNNNEEIEVVENTTISGISTPTRTGYGFVGWYTDETLNKEFNFKTKIRSNIKLYAKWEELNLNPNVEYGIVENNLYIPTNLEFSKDSHTSAKKTTVNSSSFSSGSYATNFNSSSEKTTVDGFSYSCYRYGKNSESVIIKPDNSHYNETAYHGREGGLFNITPFGGINKLEITYSASSPSTTNPTKPNVRFGKDDNCLDYVCFLEPTSTKSTETIDVNLSMYQYFSINSGDYICYISSFSVDYDNNATVNPVYEQTSGENRLRTNPIQYTKTLVAGESKITAPLAYEYDATTNTYKVTESKEFTYYTADYVRNHPEAKADATLTDPLDVCIYYTLFEKWPANYSTNVSNIQSLFGSNTRKVSKYNRTDGYCRAIPWYGNGYYYELDIDVDGSYSQSSRGVGRVVVWEKGWTADGYDSAPVCIYTDDHYNTFIEYLNNGTWSNRFNAEGRIASISYSTANTITFTGFDAKMVEGTGSGSEDNPDDIEIVPVDDTKYYANYAPKDMINESTAMWQKVTNVSGIVEDNQYAFVYGEGTSTKMFYGSSYLRAYDGFLAFDESAPIDADYNISPFYFEKANGGYYLYQINYEEKTYLGFNDTGKDLKYNEKTIWTIKFSGGNFYLMYSGCTLQYNTSADRWRTYKTGTQGPISLYRFCDIEGAVPPEEEKPDTPEVEYNTNFEAITSITDINDTDAYIIVTENSYTCLTALNASEYKIDDWTGKLSVPLTAMYSSLYFEKYSTKMNMDYYYIYVIENNQKIYLGYNSTTNDICASTTPQIFIVEVDSWGVIYIKVGAIDEDGMVYGIMNEGYETYYLNYDPTYKKYLFTTLKFNMKNDVRYYNHIFKIVEEENNNE